MATTRVSHFELIRLIGRGGMGEVWEATDLKLRRRVALKFLSAELGADRQALVRFEREALSAAELNHPNIATVHAFEPEGERPFIAMELLAGASLRDRIDAGPLTVDESLGIARDVAAALAYAHRRGTSHRDIKPENLMFDEHGTIKVMDFGLARATMASRLTVTGTSLGTPAYMSPESIRGDTGPASDVFALGLVLYEMLAGQRAFPGDNVMAVMFAIANEEPRPLVETRPEAPEAVIDLLRRLLAKDPGERIDAAAAARELAAMTGASLSSLAFAAATAPSVSGAPAPAATVASTARTAAMPARGTVVDTVATTAPMLPTAPAKRRAPVLLGLLGVVAVAAIAGIVLITGATARRRDEAIRLQRLGTEAWQAGRVDQARTLFIQALARDPKQAGALTNLGQIALEDSLFTTAESLFTAVARHHANDPKLRASAYYNIGDARLRAGLFDSAIENFESAFALDSANAESYNNLAWALIQNRRAGEALSLLERGLARFPSEKFLHKNAALAAIELGDLPTALRHLDRALQLDPEFTEAIALRTRALRLVGRDAAGLLPGGLDFGPRPGGNPPPVPAPEVPRPPPTGRPDSL